MLGSKGYITYCLDQVHATSVHQPGNGLAGSLLLLHIIIHYPVELLVIP